MKSWNSRIYDVDNPMDLLAVTREFLDSWEPDALALVPERARPQRIKGIDDIDHIAFTRADVVRRELVGKIVDAYESAPLKGGRHG